MKKAAFFLFLLTILWGRQSHATTYSTAFPLTQDPISESGNWQVPGTGSCNATWGNVASGGGFAFGSALCPQPTQFGDDTAVLTGTWGNSQTVQATVHISSTPSGCCSEVSLRARMTINSSASITGYEILCPTQTSPGYGIQVVRWNGTAGQYVYLSNIGVIQCVNGDVIKAVISGTSPVNIAVFLNGSQQGGTFCDNGGSGTGSCGGVPYAGPGGAAGPWTTGNPGMGMCCQTTNFSIFGFSAYSATDGQSPAPPASALTAFTRLLNLMGWAQPKWLS